MPKMKAVGEVKTDKMQKTRRVEIPRMTKHPKYGKYIRSRTVCYVHDENNESAVGDLVEIEESRPLSKTKRWKLVRIVRKAVVIDELIEANAEPTSEETSEEKAE